MKHFYFIVFFALISVFTSYGQGNETFETLEGSSSSYSDGKFTGQNAINWTYTEARTDQKINERALVFGKSGERTLTSDEIPNGIKSLSFNLKYFFTKSGAATIEVYVNDNKVGEFEAGADAEYQTINNINVAGNFVLKFSSTGGTRVGIDDIVWTAYNNIPSTETDIESFSISGRAATVDKANHTVTLKMPFGTDLSNLTPTITLSEGATINKKDQVDFTSPVVYTVTAENGTTTQDWTATITKSATKTPIVSFVTESITKTESNETFTINLNIVDPANVNTTVDVELTSGDAADINNYTTQTLTFNASSTATVTLPITLTDDEVYEQDEEFVFTITNPSGDAELGNKTFTLTITDNDEAPNNGYLTPDVDAEGKIIVTLTPKEYYAKVAKGDIKEGQHMMSVRIPDNYYKNAVNTSGTTLRSEIRSSISSGHKPKNYDYAWTILQDADENPKNKSEVWLMYIETGRSKSKNGGGKNDWNREHTWAKSHGNFGTSTGKGSDGHNLRATDTGENSRRGNKDFAESGGYLPPKSARGDVARIIFYMATRWGFEVDNGTGGGNNKAPRHGKLDDLLKWHNEDPVDPYEVRRNNVVYSHQKNRNPFVDHPELVEYIFGNKKNETWTGGNTATPVKKTQTITFNVPQSKKVGESITLNATASSGLPVKYILLSKDFATLTGNTLTFTKAGSVSIKAYQEGNNSYKGTEKNVSIEVIEDDGKEDQNLTVTEIATAFVNTSAQIIASVDTDLDLTYEIVSGEAFLFNKNLIAFTKAGNVTIKVSQEGTSQYRPVAKSFTVKVSKRSEGADNVVIIDEQFAQAEEIPQGWKVYKQGERSWGYKKHKNNGYFQMTGYEEKVTTDKTFVSWLVTPKVNLDNYDNEVFSFESKNGFYKHTALTVWYSKDFDNDVTTATWTKLEGYSVDERPNKSYGENFVKSGDIDLSAMSGNITIAFKWEGNNKDKTTTYQVDNIKFVGQQGGKQEVEGQITTKTIHREGTTTELTVNSNSNAAVSFQVVSGDATITNTSITFNAKGKVIVKAIFESNNDFYGAEIFKEFKISDASGKLDQELSIKNMSSANLNDVIDLAKNITVDSELDLTFEVVSGAATINSENKLSFTAEGDVIIKVSNAGNDDFNAISQNITIKVSKTIVKQTQTITFNAIAAKTFGEGTFDLTATTDSNLPIIYSSSNTDVATISGSTVTIVGAGTTSITANAAGNATYKNAVPVVQSLTVNKAAQTITITAVDDKKQNESVDLSQVASASSNLLLSYSVISGPGEINGTTLSFTAQGEVVIRVSQAGNANYNAAENKEITINVTSITSVDDLKNSSIKLYPIPAKDKIYFKSDKLQQYSYKLYDTRGSLIKSGYIQNAEFIDVINLNNGIYYINIFKNNISVKTVTTIIKH